MTSRWRMDLICSGVGSIAVLGLCAGLLLAGCSQRPSTAPASQSIAAPPDSAAGDDFTVQGDVARSTSLGGPLAGLDAATLARFTDGQTEFEDVDGLEEGLGPVFNENSCTTCHNAPVGGTTGRLETRFGRSVGGVFDPLADLGGSLLQDHAIGLVGTGANQFTYVAETVPPSANVTAGRQTTPLFGLGLVDAVPDLELIALAGREAFASPFTRGVPNFVPEILTGRTRVGRFGWKAQVPTLHQFSGDAYLNEMGVTNPEFPTENPPQGNVAALHFNPFPNLNNDGTAVGEFTDFMTLLAPPPRGPRTFQTFVGGLVFRQAGCVSCHTPTLVTGPSPVPALSRKAFQPFSDFLLHDMGTLGDGIVQGRAGGRQMRTAPLWGLSSRPVFLHDGRARTPEAAILAHEGQGRYSRDRFMGLGRREREALLAFLGSL